MGAPKQNSNAAKGKGYDGRLNVETILADKEKWKRHVKTDKTQEETLTDWVNQACKDKHDKEK
jgi:hypothetical protein